MYTSMEFHGAAEKKHSLGCLQDKFRCGNHSTSKSMVYVHTRDVYSYLCA